MNQRKVLVTIAKTHLLSKIRQTATAALGVTFGIGAYITLVSFMTGLNKMLDDMILNQTPHVHIYNEIQPSEKQPIALYSEFENAMNVVHSVKPKQNQNRIHDALPMISHLKGDPNVLSALPQVRAQVFYVAGSIEMGGVVTGVNIMEEVEYFNFRDYIVAGKPEDLKNTNNGILLGIGIAETMSLKVGDRVQVTSTNGTVFPLKIVGFFQSGLADIDNSRSYTTIKTAQKLVEGAANYITDVNLKLKDISLAPTIARSIEQQFNLRAVDINEANAQFETGTTIRNLITYAVSITLLIVAGFGIYNILNMLIYEKMNDIAILKATGFSGSDVQWIFIMQALIIGIVGGILGLLIGIGLAHLIDGIPFETEALPTVTTYPVNHNPWYYAIGITFAIVSTFFAGYLPSLRAKRVDPVKIIRGQ
ncbi:ABC transporter permease [Aureitalea sp. L0-47]|uniref:ABC transporter permease n=1 Tax=Aureitalea sp. L0-47 TaxID=2816962 RepID=UPI002236FBDF|nr:FtsX-like permease family protein [Aureitalea sp. L0-47]MCW5519831.1 ABC transporter permease [Aureitalea sp. L0-47]